MSAISQNVTQHLAQNVQSLLPPHKMYSLSRAIFMEKQAQARKEAQSSPAELEVTIVLVESHVNG